jgi:hypothetical protein
MVAFSPRFPITSEPLDSKSFDIGSNTQEDEPFKNGAEVQGPSYLTGC